MELLKKGWESYIKIPIFFKTQYQSKILQAKLPSILVEHDFYFKRLITKQVSGY